MRGALLWIGCALTLAAAACEGGAPPPSATPGDPTSTATPTAVSTVSPAASPEPTSTPTPAPVSTPSPTPEPTPAAPPIEPTPITRGEPRLLPAGLALYYAVHPCTECDAEPVDFRRVFFDHAVGSFREDRPLAFFDGARDSEHDNAVRSFGVSESGQTLAVTICDAGWCDGGVGGYPTPDAILRLWVSPDGGDTWGDWGELPPETRISEVTDGDVLVETRNVWQPGQLTDATRDALLVRLARIGIDRLGNWTTHATWVMTGEVHSRPAEPSPTAVEGVDWWFRLDDQAADTVAWAGGTQGTYLLALADESGAVEHLYSAANLLWGSFLSNDLMVLPVLSSVADPVQKATLDLVDLSTSSVHQVKGLSLPTAIDPEAGEHQGKYYHFITARPAPASLSAGPVVEEYRPLTLAEPRPQPADIAIYYGAASCEGFMDVYRTVPGDDGEPVTVERPWAHFDERPGYITQFGLGPRGQTLAALECSRGRCLSGYEDASEDALLVLWVSRDAGGTWEQWGEVPQGVWIETVTEDDVALNGSRAEAYRIWWYRSGDEVSPPEGLDTDYMLGWFPDDEGAVSPLWKLQGDGASYVTATGQTLTGPATGHDEVWSPIFLADGVLWRRFEREIASLFVATDEKRAVRGAYAWEGPQQPLRLSVRLEDQRFLGELGPLGCGTPDTTKVLVDFATRTVHPLPEVPSDAPLRLLVAQSLSE